MRIPFPMQIVSSERVQQKQPPSALAVGKKLISNKWFKFGLRLSCTIVLFTFLFKSVNWQIVQVKLRNLDAGDIGIGVILGLFGVIISAYQWQSLLDAEHIRMDLRKLVNLYLVGIAFNHFLPTGMGGDMVKAYYVSKEGQNSSGSASAVVMSRVTGFVGMLLVSIPALLLWHSIFNPGLSIAFLLSCLAMCAALGGALFLVIILPRMTGKWTRSRIALSFIKVGNTIRSSLARPRAMGTAVLFGMLFHASAALNYYYYGVELHIGHVPAAFYLVAIPFVSLVAFLPISINGFGLRESAFVYIFSTMHVSIATSLLLAFLMDLQVLFFGLIGGCIYLLMSTNKEKKRVVQPVRQAQELSV